MRTLLLIILVSLLLSAAAFSETITLAADDWCPYNCEPGSDSPGYMVEIAREVFTSAGYELEYKYVPWDMTLKAVAAGTCNGAIGATHDELPDGIFPKEELGYYTKNFIVRNGDPWRYQGINSLKKIRLGVIKGYDYGKALNTYIRQNKNSGTVYPVSSKNAIKQNLRRLLDNTIDVYLEDNYAIFYTAKKMAILNRIAVAGMEGKPKAVYICFSPAIPESKKYASILSEGLRKMRKSGRLAEILKKYYVSDWK